MPLQWKAGRELTKNERIALKKQQGLLKDRHSRKLEKFSDNFNEMFFFFLKSYRKGLLTFGGVGVDTVFERNGTSCRETFRRFDDGQYKFKDITSRHNNIVRGVITAKKSWGLHVRLWTDGIAESDFTIDEVLSSFTDLEISVPGVLLKELQNSVMKKKQAIIDDYLNGKR